MEPFNKLFLYLGQQYKNFGRDVFYEDELIQLFHPQTSEMQKLLTSFITEGYLSVVGNKLYELGQVLIDQFSNLDPSVYITGNLRGGNISLDHTKPVFTMLVEFDSSVKFIGKAQKKYNNSDIFFYCLPDKNYVAKAYSQLESGLLKEEESINRYLSRLSYCFNIPIFIKATHSASNDFTTTSVANPRHGLVLPFPDFADLELRQHQALSFYRQYMNFSGSDTRESYYYQLLSLVKILEGIHPTRNGQKEIVIKAIEGEKSKLSTEDQARLKTIEQKLKTKHDKDFGETIWEYYRHGVSHWREKGFLDPDIPDDDLGSVLNILFKMVKNILKEEYKL